MLFFLRYSKTIPFWGATFWHGPIWRSISAHRVQDSPIHGAGTHGTMFPDLAIRTAGATDARTE